MRNSDTRSNGAPTRTSNTAPTRKRSRIWRSGYIKDSLLKFKRVPWIVESETLLVLDD